MGSPDFVILGSGPVAMVGALQCARVGKVQVLASPAPLNVLREDRIEAVPASLVASLVELGIHPHAIGVFNLADRRLMAWQSREPVEEATPAGAHIERRGLERELLALVVKNRSIELVSSDQRQATARALTFLKVGVRVIDASGRAASLANRTVRPERPWVARLFFAGKGLVSGVAPFMAVSLPDGYAYRAIGRRFCTVGVVGRRSMVSGKVETVRDRLLRGDAAWMVRDLANLPWMPAGAGPASIQWSEGPVTAIGDACLARDALSSQGLARGLRDARYSAAIQSREDRDTFWDRSRLARVAHAVALSDMLTACRWRDEPLWSGYASFLRRAATS